MSTEAQAVAELTRSGLDVRRFDIEGVPFYGVPEGMEVHGMEDLLPSPKRLKASPQFRDADSFGAYVNRFKDASTLIVGNRDNGTFWASLDYHEKDKPSWVDHKAALNLRQTDEWKAWSAIPASMSQTQFAEFIEDWMHTIAAPDGATLQNMVLKFQSLRETVFKKSVNMQNGDVNLTYIDEEKEQNAKFPSTLTLVMGVYEGQLPIQVDARIRYRIQGDKLTFQIAIIRKPEVIQKAFADICDAVGNITGIKPLMGA